MPVQTLKRGAIPSLPGVTNALPRHVATVSSPLNYIRIPNQMSIWGNDKYGDCVTAEEAFAKACVNPEIFIPESIVVAWATSNNVLNGATCPTVLDLMQENEQGILFSGTYYFDGSYSWVDWQDAPTLQSAIYHGPVKLLLAADQIEAVYRENKGVSGWLATNFATESNYDHCVSLCGYGSLAWLANQLNVTLPPNIKGEAPGYAMFTWNSIGIIDVPSLLAVNHEAYLRSRIDVTENGHGLYIFQANNGNVLSHYVYLSYTEAGGWWEYQINEVAGAVMADKPSAVIFSGLMYVFYREYQSQALQYSTFDGSSWTVNLSILSAGIWGSPAAVVFNSQLYVFHQGNAHDLWYGVFDGNHWVVDQPAQNAGVWGNPTAAVIASKLYVFYTNSAQVLCYSVFDGSSWQAITVPIAITGDPSVVILNGLLNVFYQGNNNQGDLRSVAFDGTTWQKETIDPNFSISGSPCMFCYDGALSIAYQGAGNMSGMLLWTIFLSDSWQPAQPLPFDLGPQSICAVDWP